MNKLNHVKYALDQIIGKGNTEIVDSSFSDNYVAHSGDKNYSGHKFIKQFAKQIRTAIPDIKILSVDQLSHTDNTLTWQRSFTGTHKANLKGIPASNKRVKWHEMVVSRFENEKITEEWLLSDLAAQLMLKHK
jgi:predicted ester cyclase